MGQVLAPRRAVDLPCERSNTFSRSRRGLGRKAPFDIRPEDSISRCFLGSPALPPPPSLLLLYLRSLSLVRAGCCVLFSLSTTLSH